MGPNSTKSTDILKYLQRWSDIESKIAVEGVHLTALNFCTVSLEEGEAPFCETPAQAVDINSQNESTSPVTYIIVGMVALILMLIFAIVVCLATVSFYKKKKVRDRQMRQAFYVCLSHSTVVLCISQGTVVPCI